jgi:Kef-type K+ transport system membrane component KefB
MTNVQLAVQFFLQIAVILTACRVVGAVARRFGQPQVVAEMITGVLLGPSLLGWLWPDVQAALFPWDPAQASRDTQSYLFPASQLGLALYMFVVGLEFRADVIKTNLRSSVAVSLAGMLAPFALGGGLAAVLHAHTALFPERTTLPEAMLFLGSSMSITAFPMLARIIHHKGLAGTRMGTIAIGAGALDDAAAWALLALVLASFEGEPAAALVNLGAAAAYVLIMVFAVGPLLRRCEPLLLRDGQLHETGFVLALTLMALGAFTTDAIGLHAVFGAFVAGAVVPRGVALQVAARIEPLAVALLLPLFFTYSGLNTRIGLLDSASLWFWCGAVLVAAIAGKGIACWLAARLTGVPNRQALGIGVLMNARGLMELIVINIGLQRGVISPALFAILVVMAVVTTLMASPIFDRLVGSVRD